MTNTVDFFLWINSIPCLLMPTHACVYKQLNLLVPGTYNDNKGHNNCTPLASTNFGESPENIDVIVYFSFYFLCYFPQLEKIFFASYSEKKKTDGGGVFISASLDSKQ